MNDEINCFLTLYRGENTLYAKRVLCNMFEKIPAEGRRRILNALKVEIIVYEAHKGGEK